MLIKDSIMSLNCFSSWGWLMENLIILLIINNSYCLIFFKNCLIMKSEDVNPTLSKSYKSKVSIYMLKIVNGF
jgi:hypothetical protein